MAMTKGGVVLHHLEQKIQKSFPQIRSTSTSRGYVGVLITIGLLERNSERLIDTSKMGRRFEETDDTRIIGSLLVDRVQGVDEILDALCRRQMSYPDLREYLPDQGIHWQNAMALRYRIWWLRAAGVIETERRSRADWLIPTSVAQQLEDGDRWC